VPWLDGGATATDLCHIFILHVYYRVKNKKKTRITTLEYMFFILHGQFEQLIILNKRDEPTNSVLNKIRR